MWKLPVCDVDGHPLPLPELERRLGKIVDAPPLASEAAAVAALTGAGRDLWAAARAELVASSAANAAVLDAVDSALFVLCLDRDAVSQPRPPHQPCDACAHAQEAITPRGRGSTRAPSFVNANALST